MLKTVLALLLGFSSAACAVESATNENADVEKAAVTFSKWYIQQISAQKNPYEDPKLASYIADDTYKTLMQAYKADEIDYDYFIKSQDFDEKDYLAHVKVNQVVVDPVCTTVYLSFGSKESMKVADCFVQQGAQWKLKAVTELAPPPDA